MVDDRGTLTAGEHQVLEFLAAGPALLGATTGEFTVHRRPRLYDAHNQILAAARLADSVTAPKQEIVTVRNVDRATARRLAERGWVLIDQGEVTLRAHRLAKPLPGGPGDGHAVACSCGDTFASWRDAENHQDTAEGLHVERCGACGQIHGTHRGCEIPKGWR